MSKYTTFENLSAIKSLAIGANGEEVEVINEYGKVTTDVLGNVEGYALKTEEVTATETGVQLSANTTFATVTSANANHIVILPDPVPGRQITLVVGANGFELRSSAPATVGINGGTGVDAESAIGANLTVKLECISATNWIGSTVSAAGVVDVVEVAA